MKMKLFGSLAALAICTMVAPAFATIKWADSIAQLASRCDWERGLEVDAFALHHKQDQTLAETDAEFAGRVVKNIDMQKFCLGEAKRGASPDQRVELQKAIDAIDPIMREIAKESRAKFLASPSTYSMISDKDPTSGYNTVGLQRQYAINKNARSFAQTCGRFDYSIPVINQRNIELLNQRTTNFRACAKTFLNSYEVGGSIPFTMLRQEVNAFAPYVCSKRPGNGCISDKDYNAAAAITSPEAIAYIEQTWTKSNKERDLAGAELKKVNDWLNQVNAAVDRHNAGY